MAYIDTLRRIPADIRRAMATREFRMGSNLSCMCGWAIREHLHRVVTHELGITQTWDEIWENYRTGCSDKACHSVFGGSEEEWHKLYCGVTDGRKLLAIERAFVQALDEACCEGA